MAGTTEGGKKAAETRGHESLSEAGRKGGERSHSGKNMPQREQSSIRDKSSSGSKENVSDRDK